VANTKGERNYRLLRGYKYAGDVLVQKAVEDCSDQDNLIYPAIFCYRHYIELALKDVVESYGDFAGITIEKNHKLPDLWSAFLTIAEKFGNSRSAPEAIAVGNCIAELADLDATSTAFRYALNKKSELHKIALSHLDLVNLHDIMNGIELFFECADLDFSEKHQYALGSGFEDF
jgi:hypothetical protein